MDLTPEQLAIVERSQTGKSFKVAALAGTGKTTQCVAITNAVKRRSLYLAFNRSTAGEGERRFQRHVKVKTGHALAFREVGWKFKDRLTGNGWAIKNAIGALIAPKLPRFGGQFQEPKYTLAVADAIVNYQQSADDLVGEEHVPREYAKYCDLDNIACLAQWAWEQLVDEKANHPVSHDAYLKLFALQRTRLPFDQILLDEAQDTAPVMLGILALQNQAQLIAVGDENQAIYEWRGAVDALNLLSIPEMPLTQSWRFGPEIARVANLVLAARQSRYRLIGSGAAGSVVVEGDLLPTAVVARTNAGMVTEALDLIGRDIKDNGVRRRVRIGVVGGVDSVTDMVMGAYALWADGTSAHPQFRLFQSWIELLEAAETSHAGSLRPFARLVEKHKRRVPDLCDLLKRSAVSEDAADVVLSTCHKFKGLESDRVRLADDFPPFVEADEETGKIRMLSDEANLAYVALTRPRTELQIGGYEAAFYESLRLATLLLRGQTHDPKICGEPVRSVA